jgi:hypothetical protein
LYGLPGAGKTSLCRNLAQKLDQTKSYSGEQFSDHWARGNLRGWTAVGIHTIASPRLILTLVTIILRLHLWRSREAMVRILRLLVRRGKLLHMLKRDSMLLDQAMLQDVWSILVASDNNLANPDNLVPVLRELYRGISVEIIYLYLDPTTAARRVVGRQHGRSRFDGLPEVVAVQRLIRFEQLTASIAEAAQRAGLHVHPADSDTAPAVVTDAALQALRPSVSLTEA